MDDWIINFINDKIDIEKKKKVKFHYAYLIQSKCKTKLVEGKNDIIKNKTCTTTHAEMNILDKIKKWRVCPKNVDLIVINIKSNGDIGEGKPCEHCIQMLAQSKICIHNVYYSTIINNNYYIYKEKFSKMKTYDINNKKVMSKSLKYMCGNKIFYPN